MTEEAQTNMDNLTATEMPIVAEQSAAITKQTSPTTSSTAMSSTDETLRLIAFILSIVTTVALGILIIPLAWMIPMTVHMWGIYKGKNQNTIAFGVCTLIFCNVIAGILLLCSKKDN